MKYSVVVLTALCGAALFVPTSADAATLVAGGNYGSINIIFNGQNMNSVGTGSINTSTLDGRTLPYLYCLDLEHSISVPGTYQVTETTTGTVTESSYGSVALNATLAPGYTTSSTPVVLTFTQAGQIAYLLDHYGLTATTATQQEALQAAIWKEIYGSAFSLQSGDSQTTDYNTYLTNVGSDSVSNLLWLSPESNNVYQQALVTTAVPEPGNVTMIASAGLVGVGLLTLKRRRRVTMAA